MRQETAHKNVDHGASKGRKKRSNNRHARKSTRTVHTSTLTNDIAVNRKRVVFVTRTEEQVCAYTV